jgi:hypothetical protein
MDRRGIKRIAENVEITPQLDLFQELPNVSQVEETRYATYAPNSLTPTGQEIIVDINDNEELFTDLFNSEIHFTYSVKTNDGQNLGNGNDNQKAFPGETVDLMFESAQLFINNDMVEHIQNYGISSHITDLLSYNKPARSSRLFTKDWFEDEAFGRDADDRACEQARARKLDASAQRRIVLKPNFALWRQRKFLPPSTKAKLVFRRSPDSVFLNSPGANVAAHVAANKINIHKFEVRVRRIKVSQETVSALLSVSSGGVKRSKQEVSSLPFAYPIRCLNHQSQTISTGQLSDQIHVNHQKLPNKVLLVLIRQEALTGNGGMNPLNFQHFGITEARLLIDGNPIDSPYEPSFENDNAKREYAALNHISFAKGHACHDTHGISYENFINGKTIFSWITRDHFEGSSTSHRQVSLSINVKFANATPYPITALVFLEQDKTLTLDLTGLARVK